MIPIEALAALLDGERFPTPVKPRPRNKPPAAKRAAAERRIRSRRAAAAGE